MLARNGLDVEGEEFFERWGRWGECRLEGRYVGNGYVEKFEMLSRLCLYEEYGL